MIGQEEKEEEEEEEERKRRGKKMTLAIIYRSFCFQSQIMKRVTTYESGGDSDDEFIEYVFTLKKQKIN